jgi:selenocysteine-specific elongation factor
VRIDHTAIARAHLDALEEQVTQRLAGFHHDAPDEVGPDARRLKRLAAPRTDDALWRHAIDALLARGALVRSGTWLHLPDHAARLNEAEQKLAQKLLPLLAEGGFDPPWVRDLARDCAASEPMVRQTLASLARRGEAFQVVKDLYYLWRASSGSRASRAAASQSPRGCRPRAFAMRRDWAASGPSSCWSFSIVWAIRGA